ncbi:MAG: hypothetical protein QOK43_3060 [Acidimicrobiaceae bacterium]|nr:hypothetical protein [Acidimicrobiaceae bacterium]
MLGRWVRLVAGCVLLGGGSALMVLAKLGLAPWDVLHQGIARHTGIPIGTVGILVGLVVLAGWLPLRQRPGVGTAVNVVLVGVTVDVVLAVAPTPHATAIKTACLAAGVVGMALGTGLYVGAGLGPGPRDGLMTGLSARHDRSIGGVRTGIELSALLAGRLLGGRVGIGTLVFALAIGPLIQAFLRWFAIPERVDVPMPTLTTPAE